MSTSSTIALTWSGVKQCGEGGNGVLTDANGNIYVAGGASSSLDGNTYQGEFDTFLMKYDPAGNKKWTRQTGSSGGDSPNSAAMDSEGNIYITGGTDGSFEGYSNAGGNDIFLIKYDLNGNKQWVTQFGTVTDEQDPSVAVDPSGNIYVAGNTSGGLDGNANLGSQDFFLVKFDPSGNKLWTKQFGTGNWDNVVMIKTDSGGNIYLVGAVMLAGLYGNGNIGLMDAFLMKCDPDGEIRWTKQFGSPSNDVANSLATDSTGIYVAGVTEGGLYGNSNSGSYDIYLVKFNSLGERQWTKQFGSAGMEMCHAVVIDSGKNIYLAGETNGGFAGYTNAGDSDIYLIKTDPDGNELWTRQIGTDRADYGDCAVADLNDNVYVSGLTLGILDGITGGYLIKFDPSGYNP
jgi:hypothetical protein